MSENVETTPCCWGIFPKYEYHQEGLEYMMDDYGGDVVIVEEGNNEEETICFPSTKRNNLASGYYSVTMISDDDSVSLLMTFKHTNEERKLISGQMIKYGKIYAICEYDVIAIEADKSDLYARCIYKSV